VAIALLENAARLKPKLHTVIAFQELGLDPYCASDPSSYSQHNQQVYDVQLFYFHAISV
jgi:hypothetical protein